MAYSKLLVKLDEEKQILSIARGANINLEYTIGNQVYVHDFAKQGIEYDKVWKPYELKGTNRVSLIWNV